MFSAQNIDWSMPAKRQPKIALSNKLYFKTCNTQDNIVKQSRLQTMYEYW